MSPAETPTPTEITDAPTRRTVRDVTCLACGCFCDDLAVSVDREQVTEVRSACAIGREWFLAKGGEDSIAEARVEGRSVETGEAVERAVAILAGSRAPVVWGLTRTTTETVRAALELADLLGARVVLDRTEADLGRVAAFQDQGRITATLGEVKNRADLVIFWGVDPLTTHPRHAQRYSVEPEGRFVTGGRAGRTVVVVDREPNATAAIADRFLKVPTDRQVEALMTLRMLVRGTSVDRPSDGLEFAALEDLAARMKAARYGAMFFQGAGEMGWWAASRLVRDLNEFTRFVILGMGSPGNLGGAEAALTWQAGSLQGVDYRLGRPSPLNDRTTIEECLRAREADAVLAVAGGLPGGLSEDASGYLATIPTVLIGPGATGVSTPLPTVALATATAGFDASGTVVRSDGVTLPLRPLKTSRFPEDREWIVRLTAAIKVRRPS